MKIYIGNYPGPRSKKPRKINIEINSYDTYSLDHTLALIIHPSLVAFREKVLTHGYPGKITNECFPEYDYKEPMSDQDFDVCMNKWLEYIDAMIWSFNEIVNEYPGREACFSDVKEEDRKPRFEPIPGSKFGKFNSNLIYDKEMCDKYTTRFEYGLSLFGIWYENLWW